MACKRALSSLRSLSAQASRLQTFPVVFSARPPYLRNPPELLPQRRWNSHPTHPSPASPVASATSSTSANTSSQPKQASPIKSWSYEDILAHTAAPSPTTILIDVREPSETAGGYIPSAKFLPITSHPEALFLPAEEFVERFGWEKPGPETEVVFYCKAGVRSRAAARMARVGGWGRVGDYMGSWVEWQRRRGGGEVSRSG